MFLPLRFVKNHPTEQVHALIRKEFERNKNESRPEVVEVAEHIHFPCSPHHSNSRGFFQNLKSNAAAALTHYLFYVTHRLPFPPFTFMSWRCSFGNVFLFTLRFPARAIKRMLPKNSSAAFFLNFFEGFYSSHPLPRDADEELSRPSKETKKKAPRV